jgi:zinc protease
VRAVWAECRRRIAACSATRTHLTPYSGLPAGRVDGAPSPSLGRGKGGEVAPADVGGAARPRGRRSTPALLLLALLYAAAVPAAGEVRHELPNGMQVIVSPSPATEVVAAELMLRIPAADEPPDQAGIRYLTHQLLLRGSQASSGDALGEQLASVGGSIGVSVGLDYVEVHVLAPADGFETALGVMAESVRTPAFLPEEIERGKQSLFASVRGDDEDPFQAVYLALRQALYGDSPYGRRTQGDPEAVAALTRDDLVSFHRAHYVPRRAVLAIAGGVTGAQAMGAAEQYFGGWSDGPATVADPPEMPALRLSDVVVRELPAHHAYLMLAVPAPAAGGPHYYAMQVIDSILGAGTGARLPQALREELGLAYDVSSFFPTLLGDSHLGVYVTTEPNRLTPVKDAIVQELERLRQEPVPADELARAKRLLLAAHAMSRQRALSQAYWMAWCSLLGLGPDADQQYQRGVESVTPADIQATARDFMDHFVLALALPRD